MMGGWIGLPVASGGLMGAGADGLSASTVVSARGASCGTWFVAGAAGVAATGAAVPA
jgi:hypothetical protein